MIGLAQGKAGNHISWNWRDLTQDLFLHIAFATSVVGSINLTTLVDTTTSTGGDWLELVAFGYDWLRNL